jgi:hypothetical protein
MKLSSILSVLVCALAACVIAPGATLAQIENNLSSYTGPNAEGYLEPLKDAVGSALNTGLYTSGRVPKAGLHVRVEARGMVVNFGDDDRTFEAVTEEYFPDQQTVDAPTVVGSTAAVTVTDPVTHASFAFPGGFDVDRIALAAPQLVVGGVMGTEAIVRYFAMETGDVELGDVSLFGIGARHSVSQYFPGLPIDVAAMIFWQSFELGDGELIDAKAITFGVQGSKSFGLLEPYAGLSMDSFQMDVNYETDINGETESLAVEFDRDNGAHLTLGSALHLGFVHLNGEVNIADQTGFTLGLGLGN